MAAFDESAFRMPLVRHGRDRFLPDAEYDELAPDRPSGLVALARTADLHALATRLRQASPEGWGIGGGDIAAYAALCEVLTRVLARYRAERSANVLRGLDAQLGEVLGEEQAALLSQLATSFPTRALDRGETDSTALLLPEDGRDAVLAGLLLLGASRRNLALVGLRGLFVAPDLDDDRLDRALSIAAAYFETKPRFGPDHQTLFEMFLAPARSAPTLREQLDFVVERWVDLVPTDLRERVLRARDELVEAQKEPLPPGPGRAEVPTVARHRRSSEHFRASPEVPWMTRTMLVAKNAKVWLHQLGTTYERDLTHLDDIPDEALAELVGRGFSALWLIGVWERSPASRRIKQRRGHVDAEASAYSLFDYRIAEDLGGDAALDRLAEKAGRAGLRLAADMVPNHTGIYSRWVIDHPDWFLGTDHPPYPSYQFTGPDLAQDPDVEVRIEDGYWDHRDAAVAFERLDKHTGERRYLYHGNDGTQMPWNDTAQLDFTNPEVRRAVLETVLAIARRFPLLRFDAAMTLTRFHYQRLWFPAAGSAGAIPSRARFGLTTGEFEASMPNEFWREVVEAAAVQVPDALFMAEAFWLTESLFVRELGMHRVYNSAFMKMLSGEKNAEYRGYLAEIVAHDPPMLGRLVNFMTNPDEDPAESLFGKGDKYFGVATMLVTMPGLPMFGHGQVEGFTEKYGMEFQRAYWDEPVDSALVRRHYEQLVPLMRNRVLFAGTDHFVLFDLTRPDGSVDEQVFAYVNGAGSTRVLVLYNNHLDSTEGVVRTSRPQFQGGGAPQSRSLLQALGLEPSDPASLKLREMRTGLDWALDVGEVAERGLHVTLRGYEAFVLRLDWPTAEGS